MNIPTPLPRPAALLGDETLVAEINFSTSYANQLETMGLERFIKKDLVGANDLLLQAKTHLTIALELIPEEYFDNENRIKAKLLNVLNTLITINGQREENKLADAFYQELHTIYLSLPEAYIERNMNSMQVYARLIHEKDAEKYEALNILDFAEHCYASGLGLFKREQKPSQGESAQIKRLEDGLQRVRCKLSSI